MVQPNGLLLVVQCCFLVYAGGLEVKAVEGITTAGATRLRSAYRLLITWEDPSEWQLQETALNSH